MEYADTADDLAVKAIQRQHPRARAPKAETQSIVIRNGRVYPARRKRDKSTIGINEKGEWYFVEGN